MIETLTDDEREALADFKYDTEWESAFGGPGAKALRILDAQAARIDELESAAKIQMQIRVLMPAAHELEQQIQNAVLATFGHYIPAGDSATRAREMDSLRLRIVELEKQLPEGMQHCTIKFIECPVGHGRLTATNWVDNGCLWCRIAELEAELAEVLRTGGGP